MANANSGLLMHEGVKGSHETVNEMRKTSIMRRYLHTHKPSFLKEDLLVFNNANILYTTDSEKMLVAAFPKVF